MAFGSLDDLHAENDHKVASSIKVDAESVGKAADRASDGCAREAHNQAHFEANSCDEGTSWQKANDAGCYS
jgi:hypothetical protein